MGAAFSGGSLCRMVGGAEIVVSCVIIGYGAQVVTFFYSMDEQLQETYDRIQYSAFTAITQGTLTILASLMILFASRQKPGQPYLDVTDDISENGEIEGFEGKKASLTSSKSEKLSLPRNESYTTYITATSRLKQKLAVIYRLWLSFSVLSIGLLLVVFMCSMDYCIQNDLDKLRYNQLSDGGKNEYIMEDGKRRVIPPCYAVSEETTDLRTALSDLYSYCLINIFVIVCFMFVVYYQLKRVTRRRPVKEDKVRVLASEEPERVEERVVEGLENRGVGDGQ